MCDKWKWIHKAIYHGPHVSEQLSQLRTQTLISFDPIMSRLQTGDSYPDTQSLCLRVKQYRRVDEIRGTKGLSRTRMPNYIDGLQLRMRLMEVAYLVLHNSM